MAPACKVTVVCTAFNHERYLRDALEGFVRQETDFPFEVLVNDDASTDGTAAILREYAEKYPEIIRPFYQEKNLYSQGVNIYDAVFYPVARGEYIAICEGDDYWTDPQKLQLQADFLDAHPDYVACVHNTVAHTVGSDEPDRILFARGADRDVPFEQVVRGMSHAFHTSSIMARRDYITHPPAFRSIAFQHGFTDYAVGIWLTLNGRVRFLDRCMSVYNISSGVASWSSDIARNYEKLKRFIVGQREMLVSVRSHVSGEQAALVDQVILEREYELLYIEGRVEEMVRPPYDTIHRSMGRCRIVSTQLKRMFPALHRLYRRKKGYGE